MTEKFTTIVPSSVDGELGCQCLDILERIENPASVISIVFFTGAGSSVSYSGNLQTLRSTVKSFYSCAEAPLVTYVAQATAERRLVAEVLSLSSCSAVVRRCEDCIILQTGGCREILTRGINFPEAGNTGQQSDKVFRRIRGILETEGFSASDIVRQWNYIAGITDVSGGVQNYQMFNDSRSAFYADADWTDGYPAATGIGCSEGGVTVVVYAVKGFDGADSPIDNPLQIPAHKYSSNVLASGGENRVRTTPKFERGRLLGNVVFVSGTAAIKGENSEMSCDAREQALSAIEVVESLVAPANISAGCKGFRFEMLRVYVRNQEDMETVSAVFSSYFSGVPMHFLQAGICRPELLLELEGTGRAEV